jgi:hypothetical protein
MRNIFLSGLLVILFSSYGQKDEKVLICKGSMSYAYHKEYCKGLNKCTKEVVEVNKSEAINT